MKIKLLSDVHLEFGGMPTGEGDVLILAGDIVNVKEMKDETPQGKYFTQWLEDCANNYKKVFMVLGNHEHYGGNIDKTAEHLQKILDVPDCNITLLNNSYEEYEGINFIGGTLWTNYDNENYDKMLVAKKAMSDYYVIDVGEPGSPDVDKLLPSDTVKRHNETLEYLDKTLPTLKGDTVVITHHAPHKTSLSGDYVDDEISAAYYSDLEDFILKHGPTYWCHGHIHHTNDYNVGGTRIMSNPRGYRKYNENPDFNPDFEWTVGEVAQETLIGEAECVIIGE